MPPNNGSVSQVTADSISFAYDPAGRPSSVAFDRGTIGFTYNAFSGNLTNLSAPGGLGLAFTYDGSLPTSVTWSGTVSGATAVTYNNDFRVTGQTVNGGHAVSFGYDLDGLLTQAGALGLRRSATNGRLDADSITESPRDCRRLHTLRALFDPGPYLNPKWTNAVSTTAQSSSVPPERIPPRAE